VCLGDDVDLALVDTLAELHQELHGPADRRGRKTRDRPRRESPLELTGPQEDLEPAAREGDPDAPIVRGIGRRLEKPLGLEPLNERRRLRSRHSELGRDGLGRPTPDRDGDCVPELAHAMAASVQASEVFFRTDADAGPWRTTR